MPNDRPRCLATRHFNEKLACVQAKDGGKSVGGTSEKAGWLKERWM